MKTRTSQHGMIAILAVLILGAVALGIGVGVSLRSIADTQISLEEELAFRATMLAHSCAEQALLELVYDPLYVGPETISIDGDTCTINTITTPAPDQRLVQTWSTIAGYTRRVVVEVENITVSPIDVGTWYEVDSF